MSFLSYRHPDYKTRHKRARFARLYRTGRAAREAEKQATKASQATVRDGHRLHLIRRSQGETLEAYRERVYVSRFPAHMSRVVTSYIGTLMQGEDKATRTWGEALGTPQEEDSDMARYWTDIDGEGTSMPQKTLAVADRLTTSHRQWYLVDPPADPNGRARLHLLSEGDVVNWVSRNGRLIDVLVKEQADTRSSIEEQGEGQETYIRYTLDGWTRYRQDSGSAAILEQQEWEFGFYDTPGRDKRRLPIAYVDLMLDEPVGYNMARGNKYLYNLLSDLRWGLRRTSFSKLTPRNETLTKKEFELAARSIEEGHNFLPFPADYPSPDARIFEVAYDIFQEEVRDYYITAFQSYEDSARERTATEIQQDAQSGRFSFLSVLANAVDEWENDVLNLLHQVERPDEPGTWREASVERSKDFQPLDAEERADKLMRSVFGNTVPLGADGEVDAAQQIAKLLGVEASPEDIADEVGRRRDQRAQAADAGGFFG